MREGRHMDKKIKKAIAEVVQILFGTGLFGLAVNQLILPFGLYNTGFLGIAQVIASILTDVTRIYRGSFDRNRSGHCVDHRSCRRRTGYRGNVYYRAQSQGVCWHHVHYY